MASANGVIARNQTSRLLAEGDYFAANAGAATYLRNGHTVGPRSVYRDAIRSRSCAPQITYRARWYTKLRALASANRVTARDRANRLLTNVDGFATNTRAAARIGDGYAIGARCVYGDAICSRTRAP